MPVLNRRSAIAGSVAGARARHWAMHSEQGAANCVPPHLHGRRKRRSLVKIAILAARYSAGQTLPRCAIVQLRIGRAIIGPRQG